MVNYKRIVCEVAVILTLLNLAASAPVDCKDSHGEHYDQRQNGTENYRLNIDGVVIAVAPADSLLAAVSDLDFNDMFDLDDLNELKPKPPAEDKPPKPILEPKPQEGKPTVKPESVKPEGSLSDVSLNSDVQSQKKEATNNKKEKAQR